MRGDDTERDGGGATERAPAAPVHAAWLRYQAALASDGDCAVAASLAYRSLPHAARVAWLDALEEDAAAIGAVPVAFYAPLLAVEHDAGLAARIREAIGPVLEPMAPPSALAGRAPGGAYAVAVLVRPTYLDFADLVACRYSADGVDLAVREPLRRRDALPTEWEGVSLAPAPLAEVIDELAHAVVADRRAGRAPREALVPFAELFAVAG